MLLFKNELGWRLHQGWNGCSITRAHPPLSSRLPWLLGPAIVNLWAVVCVWLGAYKSVLCILLGYPALLLVLWLAGANRARHIAIYSIPGVFVFLGVLTKTDMTLHLAVGTIPGSLLLGLYFGWFLPKCVVTINLRRRLVIGIPFSPRLPFSGFRIEIDRVKSTGRHCVFLKYIERPWDDFTTEYVTWARLVWESSSQTEAYELADRLRELEIGEPDD
jgi:hypothetical protein